MRRLVPVFLLVSLVLFALTPIAHSGHYQRFQAAEGEDVIASFGADGKELVEIRARKSLVDSGDERGRGAIRLIDTISNREAEIGYYAYGLGIFSRSLLETFTPAMSIRNFEGDYPGLLHVRDGADTMSGLFLLGSGEIGSQSRAIDFVMGSPGPDSARRRVGGLTDAPLRATSLLIQINAAGKTTVRRVKVGRPDSGGRGFRILRVKKLASKRYQHYVPGMKPSGASQHQVPELEVLLPGVFPVMSLPKVSSSGARWLARLVSLHDPPERTAGWTFPVQSVDN